MTQLSLRTIEEIEISISLAGGVPIAKKMRARFASGKIQGDSFGHLEGVTGSDFNHLQDGERRKLIETNPTSKACTSCWYGSLSAVSGKPITQLHNKFFDRFGGVKRFSPVERFISSVSTGETPRNNKRLKALDDYLKKMIARAD